MVMHDEVKAFWDYLEYYPQEDEDGFDGVHFGGIKGIHPDAPEEAKTAYEEFKNYQEECEVNRIKM